MKSQTLSATAMILLTPLAVLAFQAQAEQIRNRELKNKSFTVGSFAERVRKSVHWQGCWKRSMEASASRQRRDTIYELI